MGVFTIPFASCYKMLGGSVAFLGLGAWWTPRHVAVSMGRDGGAAFHVVMAEHFMLCSSHILLSR